MIDLERLKMPVLLFVAAIVILVILAHTKLVSKSIFFDERGKIKQYGLNEETSPIPLKGIVIVLAIVVTVVMFKPHDQASNM